MSKSVAAGILVAILLAAYSNHFHNSFHFDDAHTIENNAAIRELGNIPQFFRDATTFSSLPSNQSYRPLVSTLLAIDFWLSASPVRQSDGLVLWRARTGLNPFWFHLSIFALFLVLVLVLVIVIDRLLEIFSPSPWNRWIALGAAVLYGLHPANADTVNYIIASSEVISTLGIIASFALYLGFPQLRQYYIYVLPAAIAILAKPIAAIFPVLFGFYCVLLCQNAGESRRRIVAKIATPFLLCGGVLLFVGAMTPRTWVAGATNPRNYLITQPYVMLLYFNTVFWPSGLSADYDLNPFTKIDDPRFWAGLIFVALFTFCAIAFSISKKTRLIGFGLLWFLITLLPTSLFPLAEVMNDHRTFLPYIGLIISFAGLVAILLQGPIVEHRSTRVALCLFVLLILSINAFGTFQRNKVWRNEETLWRDVTIKSPLNGRGLMNYGNTLMARGDYNGALDYFHRAQELTPNYSVLLINLGIAEDATKETATAEQHFKDALRLAPASPDSYTYYARYLIAHSRAEEARAFVQSALELSPNDETAQGLLAQTQAANRPAAQTPEYYLDLSLQLYREERYPESIAASRAALKLRPNYAEAWNNVCAAYNKLGRYDEAVGACEQALRYKPDFDLARNNLQYAREKLKTAGE